MAAPSTFGLRVINRSRAIERVYARLNSLRSLAVVAFASEATLDEFNASAYSTAERYDPKSPAYVSTLYPWEEAIIEEFFPPAPARILVGGAGAGREALTLAERGYEVLAFEPVTRLAEVLASQATDARMRIGVYQGTYRDLPDLNWVGGDSSVTLDQKFHAGIVGWGSFSHLYTEPDRVDALQSMGALTNGPSLVSFIATRPESFVPSSHIRRWLVGRRGRHHADRFSISTGFLHPINEQELRELATAAHLEVLAVRFSAAEDAPHSVLAPADRSDH